MNKAAPCKGFVVVVEDDHDTRELLRELLEGRGHRVATAQDGVEGLAVLRDSSAVCFVILDLFMPRMDGFAVLAAMARDPRLSAFPLCLSTSAPEQAPAGVRCLAKPIDVNRLFALIDQNCRG